MSAVANPRQKDTVVVGAGAVGLSVAYWLALAGESVHVIERAAVGDGASFANGGWVHPSYAAPLPGPSAARYALSSIGRADSAIYVQPRLDLKHLTWLTRFLLHCRRTPYKRGAAALIHLAEPTVALYQQLQDSGVNFEFKRTGHLQVFADQSNLKAALAAAETVRSLGYDPAPETLSGDDARLLEPVLSDEVAAGLLYPHEGYIDSLEFSRALADRLKAMGVQITTDAEVGSLERVAGQVTGCLTTDGRRFAADRVVLAGGAGTASLMRRMGEAIPLRAGKGYSFNLSDTEAITRTIMLDGSKVGLTPLGARTRVLGMMEFSDERTTIAPVRIAAMLVAARRYLRGVPADLTAEDVADAWVGLRPMTVDGLPIIDRCRSHRNAFVATGHGMLGITLAPATGQALAGYIQSDRRPAVLEPFRLDRFRRLAPRRRPSLKGHYTI